MRWIGRQGSGNVQDRRGGGMGGRLAIGGGLGGIVILILSLLLGNNPLESINVGTQSRNESPGQVPGNRLHDEQGQFVSVVLKETENVWNSLFQQEFGKDYQEPQLILFTQLDRSGCGTANAAMGPFYCPLDNSVYIDLSFYDELSTRFGASGDFAMAYVVAHEVGHHVQNLLGTSDKIHQARQALSEREGNKLSVALELQADFYAGVWAHHTQKKENILEEGDIEEALRAANAIGDDRLQKQSQGYVVPDAFTHGTSEQRMYWFKKGWETGDVKEGNTFDELL
ncbi:KPN_02809 family neutral zinc metallopeptidase [Chryseosolibacter indicus]|uniref:Zinc metallopeptidase n=1 Tax=Chryseosolibacter indicus TaxID=2782351 RepID=A0ABS5VL64_9BACT|nr:neutral zinc metallopeptidase [Chryseosolibacter indicus]MBT1701846.1 zinc metallopeptidase [Chryseosolibacter indicus]